MDYEDIYTEGITKITAEDIKYAKSMGKAIKLLASSKRVGDSFYAMVAPFLISSEHPLYSVNNVFNGIYAHGNVLGDVMFYGSGAGKLPTASAVVADVVDAAKHMNRNIMQLWSNKKLELADISTAERKFFVRMSGDAKTRLEEIHKVFGEVQLVTVPELQNEFGFITNILTEAKYQEKADNCQGIINRIRIED